MKAAAAAMRQRGFTDAGFVATCSACGENYQAIGHSENGKIIVAQCPHCAERIADHWYNIGIDEGIDAHNYRKTHPNFSERLGCYNGVTLVEPDDLGHMIPSLWAQKIREESQQKVADYFAAACDNVIFEKLAGDD